MHNRNWSTTTLHTVLVDSKSWTPKIISDAKNTLTDAIGLGSRQKKSDKDDEDDPLQLLPEKRIIRHSLPMPQPRIDPNLTEK